MENTWEIHVFNGVCGFNFFFLAKLRVFCTHQHVEVHEGAEHEELGGLGVKGLQLGDDDHDHVAESDGQKPGNIIFFKKNLPNPSMPCSVFNSL